ncbi:hypothetical protein LUZ63_016712 [Rhynchospora breviuscula]|uniref:RNase H type-1 domain-containing protein n=1 Tax=Rhynchospora breviuscula TaxID=2022672 RepID=A0A9Q0C1D6_9POAL|nr:hypothetical protein LUZ63_016712 [Rhynchospora breviuscula]
MKLESQPSDFRLPSHKIRWSPLWVGMAIKPDGPTARLNPSGPELCLPGPTCNRPVQARPAPPLSISMYADDLMIMGKVSSMEVHHILSTIRSFEAVSGQRINPEKTKLWFSAVTPTNRRQEILNIFGGSQALTDETYLGLPVHPASLKTCQGLLSKFTSKLATWKMTSLSMPVVWSIGDGNTCPAVGEPWFEGWKDFNPITRLQRELKIRDLCLPTSGLWDIQKLLTMLNMSSALHILSNPQKIPTTTGQPDRLVWIPERSGTFSVKSAYKTIQLSRQQTTPAQPHPVDFFWKNISLKPKIKLFLWKLCAKALPTCSRLAARIRSIDPIFQRCRVSEETDYYVFFGCNISRATWFASPLQIRSDLIEETVPAFLFRLSNSLPQSDFSYACALMWAIWEERNRWVFDKKSATPEQIMQKTKSQLGTQVGSAHSFSISSHEMGPTPSRTPLPTINNEQLYIYIDGAWNLDRGGWGCCIMKGLHLISFACGGMASSCPFHAEATALFRAILEIKEVLLQRQMEFTQINFLSDCLVLVNTVNKRDFNNAGPDWRVDRLFFYIWDQMETLHCCNLAHIAREDNEVAHGLAYNGRALVQETRAVQPNHLLKTKLTIYYSFALSFLTAENILCYSTNPSDSSSNLYRYSSPVKATQANILNVMWKFNELQSHSSSSLCSTFSLSSSCHQSPPLTATK